jgi:hypothetical protein
MTTANAAERPATPRAGLLARHPLIPARRNGRRGRLQYAPPLHGRRRKNTNGRDG